MNKFNEIADSILLNENKELITERNSWTKYLDKKGKKDFSNAYNDIAKTTEKITDLLHKEVNAALKKYKIGNGKLDVTKGTADDWEELDPEGGVFADAYIAEVLERDPLNSWRYNG